MLKAVQSTEPRWLRLHDELVWGGREGDLDEAVMRRLAGLRLRGGPVWRRLAAAAVVAAVVSVVGALAWSARRGGVEPRRPYPRVDFDAAVAIVVRLDRVDWGPGNEPRPAAGDLVPAGRLSFRSGRLTLSMLSGAVLAVEGPADFDLVAVDRVFCRVGRLRSKVPREAEGLVIASPAAAVLDLGTEFGMNVQPGGRSRVKVFQGRVEALARTESGYQNASRLVDERRAVEIGADPGEIRPAEGPDDFPDSTDVPPPALELDPAYPAAVLAARPRCYWRFEAMEDGVVRNEVAGGGPLRATGPVRLSDPARGNRAAVFPPGEPLQYLAMDGTWEAGAGPEYAVELWFLTEAVDHSCLASMPSPAGTNHHALILETSSRNRHAMHPPGSIRFLDRWPPALWGGYNLYSRVPYVPHRWHHAVAQVRGGRMELYLDGRPTRAAKLEVSHATTPCRLVLGRLSTIPGDGDTNPDNDYIFRRPLVGRLDEVALYDHALPAEEVLRHYALAVPKAPQ